MLNVAINGATGRMGKELLSIIEEDNKYSLAFAKSQDVANGIINALPNNCIPDVVIDFSSPSSTLELLAWCVEQNVPLVIGTTGFNDEQLNVIQAASTHIPVLLSPNMSLSVNVLFKVSQLVARSLSDSEVEIIESHHRFKKDAPSGTAIRLGEVIANSRGDNFVDVAKFNRTGVENETRYAKEIGFSVIRGGDIIGKHTAMFLTAGEELSLTSEITDRKCFATGALKAAAFIVNKKYGLFNMDDVLGLKNI